MFSHWLIFVSVLIQINFGLKCDNFPSCKEQREIVKLHNEKRQAINATNMRKMRYNHTLAEQALIWTKKCNFSHRDLQSDLFGNVGQNLWAINTKTFTWKQPIDDWASENISYVYSPYQEERGGNCSKAECGHFTQLAWAETTEVGCAFVKCESLSYKGQVGTKMWAVVCDYFPPGNKVDEYPYEYGIKLSNCPEEFNTSSDGLCSNEYIDTINCTHDGSGIPNSARVCADVSFITTLVLLIMAWLHH